MSATIHSRRVLRLLFRWAIGMAVVSWRYLWQTTPLHRSTHHDDTSRPPPPIPKGIDESGLQQIQDGVGSMFHRRFRVEIKDALLDAEGLMDSIVTDLGGHVPREVVHLRSHGPIDEPLKCNDDFVVDMPGPWNGPVRVIVIDESRLRLATRAGHLEAGQIEFHAYDEDELVVFEIEAWARPSSRLVHLLYSRIRIAKEIQLNMWVRFCKAAAKTSHGHPSNGISISTYQAPAPPHA